MYKHVFKRCMEELQQDIHGSIDAADKEANTQTFDEGKGKSDIIVMSGPLSQVYTNALNVYFAKKDLGADGSDADALVDQEIEEAKTEAATESMVNDAIMAKNFADYVFDTDRDTVADNVEFVTDEDDIDQTVSAVILTSNETQMTQPEFLEAATATLANSSERNTHVVLFVESQDGLSPATGNIVVTDEMPEAVNGFTASQKLEAATETFRELTGNKIPVLVGRRALVEWVVKKYAHNR